MTTSPFRYRPQLSEAAATLTHDVEVVDERGRRSVIAIPAERPLTVYVDKRELVTLMTLGGAPEALTLGYLRNQRLVRAIEDVVSVQVDWAVDAVAVVTTFFDVRSSTSAMPWRVTTATESTAQSTCTDTISSIDFTSRWLRR